MAAVISPNPPIRTRKRSEQITLEQQLRESSAKFNRILMLRFPARFVIYYGLFHLMMISPIQEWRVVWFAIIAGIGFTLLEELIWRSVMVPLMEREMRKLSVGEGGGE
ncbi:MAG: hypothetical protein EOP87_06705 [Verrucomicrobiaceae bacterium]|nr:MAG: hypothetical protein EOP87_06705 [Verrucomicrobiaceae bacterium]